MIESQAGAAHNPHRPLAKEPITKYRPDPASSTIQNRARRQTQHWNLPYRPPQGNAKHRQMPGLLIAFSLIFAPSPLLAKSSNGQIIS